MNEYHEMHTRLEEKIRETVDLLAEIRFSRLDEEQKSEMLGYFKNEMLNIFKGQDFCNNTVAEFKKKEK